MASRTVFGAGSKRVDVQGRRVGAEGVHDCQEPGVLALAKPHAANGATVLPFVQENACLHLPQDNSLVARSSQEQL